jgi:hypothetical protein
MRFAGGRQGTPMMVLMATVAGTSQLIAERRRELRRFWTLFRRSWITAYKHNTFGIA